MEFLSGLGTGIGGYALPFLVALTVVVFVHELGHYAVARLCGVRVEVFSIGFGPEMFGITDRHGTRWKFSLVPLGGYVKMFGDRDAASTPGGSAVAMTPEERAVAFPEKSVGRRAAIVAVTPSGTRTLARNVTRTDGESWQGSRVLAWIASHWEKTKGCLPPRVCDGSSHWSPVLLSVVR